MKAAIFDGSNIKITEIPQPIPNTSKVLIRVKSAGICGTDLAIVKGNYQLQHPLFLVMNILEKL